MHAPADQNFIDKKIHHFLNSKSPWRTVGKSIAGHVVPHRPDERVSDTDIAYEPLDWNHSESVSRTHWRKAY